MALPILGLVSSYREGELAQAAVRSLETCCRRILVLEGQIGGPDLGEAWPSMKRTGARRQGGFVSDAEKRTALLRWAQDVAGGPFWALWLDGDEQLVNGSNLPLWTRRAEMEPWETEDLHVTGGFPLRVVELDGTTSQGMGRIFRGDLIGRFLLSSTQLELRDGKAVVGAGNTVVWRPGEPLAAVERPPLQGEPHVLHLSELRDPARGVERQSAAEVRSVREQAARIGIALPERIEA